MEEEEWGCDAIFWNAEGCLGTITYRTFQVYFPLWAAYKWLEYNTHRASAYWAGFEGWTTADTIYSRYTFSNTKMVIIRRRRPLSAHMRITVRWLTLADLLVDLWLPRCTFGALREVRPAMAWLGRSVIGGDPCPRRIDMDISTYARVSPHHTRKDPIHTNLLRRSAIRG